MNLDREKLDGLIPSLRFDIENAIKTLLDSGEFGSYEKFLIDLYVLGFSISDISAIFGCARSTLDKEMFRICKRIADFLGDNYFEV